MTVRLRFAPSPTGNLHIGSARTALFNFLYTRYLKGTFVLRIEDTDTLRSKKEFEEDILSGLRWLGIEWDEGPGKPGLQQSYDQLERWHSGIYQRYAQELLASGQAYRCFCSSSEDGFVYKGTCRHLSVEQVNENLKKGLSFAIRFKVPHETVMFKDLVRGDISFDMSLNGDLVIMRADGVPTYNFAVVVDDMEMAITHVIRGEDHISNTPKQIQLFKALGKAPPLYGHISMILGSDRSKLSKRHGAKSISEFMKEGYLAPAIVNFLALLGWSHPQGKEILSMEELCQIYDIERVSKSNSIFDVEKLNWMNGQYIRSLGASLLFEAAKPFISENALKVFSDEEWLKIMDVIKDKLCFLTDVNLRILVFLKETIEYEPGHLDDQAIEMIHQFGEALKTHPFEVESLTALADQFVADRGVKKALFFHPLRYAVTGETKGSALFQVLNILGREKVCGRIADCVRFYESYSTGG